nr:hypothetical protein [Paraburkholderia xenovorans]
MRNLSNRMQYVTATDAVSYTSGHFQFDMASETNRKMPIRNSSIPDRTLEEVYSPDPALPSSSRSYTEDNKFAVVENWKEADAISLSSAVPTVSR